MSLELSNRYDTSAAPVFTVSSDCTDDTANAAHGFRDEVSYAYLAAQCTRADLWMACLSLHPVLNRQTVVL